MIASILLVTFIACNVIGGAFPEFSSLLDIARALPHICLPFMAASIAAFRKFRPPSSQRVLAFLLFLSFSMIVNIGISIFANKNDIEEIARLIVIFSHVVNISIIWPILLTNSDGKSLRVNLSWIFCAFSLLVFVVGIYYYVRGESPYFRLGYPLIPGVFSYMMAAASVVAILQLNRPSMFAVFSIGVFLSGSRSTVIFLAIFFITLLLLEGRKTISRFAISKNLLFIVFLSLCAGIYVTLNLSDVVHVARPYLIERVDILSGRGEIWSQALDAIRSRPIIGYGARMTFDISTDGPATELVAHNALLDLAVSYGLLSMLLALGFWIAIVWVIVTRPDIRPLVRSPVVWLAALVTFKALVSNIFWTNLGDPVTYFVLIMCLSTIYSAQKSGRYKLHTHRF